jgi:hypothetical protein
VAFAEQRDHAFVLPALGVIVEEPMQLRGEAQEDGAQPQDQHERNRRKAACAARATQWQSVLQAG